MKVNELEKIVILDILNDNGMSYRENEIEEIVVLERIYTGVGFFTECAPHPILQVGCTDSTYGVDCNILLNGEILVGFIYYVENGYLESIEGYTYQEPWPEQITAVLKLS